MSLFDGKQYELPTKDKERLEREVWSMCVEDGRAARSCGLPVTKCPPFRSEDMAVSWRMGWRYRDEELNRHA